MDKNKCPKSDRQNVLTDKIKNMHFFPLSSQFWRSFSSCDAKFFVEKWHKKFSRVTLGDKNYAQIMLEICVWKLWLCY